MPNGVMGQLGAVAQSYLLAFQQRFGPGRVPDTPENPDDEADDPGDRGCLLVFLDVYSEKRQTLMTYFKVSDTTYKDGLSPFCCFWYQNTTCLSRNRIWGSIQGKSGWGSTGETEKDGELGQLIQGEGDRGELIC